MPSQSFKQRVAEDWVKSLDLPVWFVYGLVNEDGQIVYVGKTKDAYKRLRHHKEKELRGEKYSQGDVAQATILDGGLTEEEAFMCERRRYVEFEPKHNRNRPSDRPGRARET